MEGILNLFFFNKSLILSDKELVFFSNNLIKSDKAIKTMQEQNKKQVYCLEQLTLYRCLSDINKKFGYNNGYISTCCNGKKENAYGLHWYYIDDLLKKMKYIKL